jgi:uncharacterized protein YjdB
MKKIFLFLMLGLMCTIGMISCGKEDTGSGDVALTDITVTTTPSPLNLLINGSGQITATAVPEKATGVSFEWSSDNTDVATVIPSGPNNQTGVVSAKAEGTATITVKSGSIQKTVTVTVSKEEIPLTDVRVNRPEITKSVGDTALVIPVAVPKEATEVTYTWESANAEIATVDNATGIITITGVGSTTVTVTGVNTGGTKTATVAVVGTIKSLAVVDESGESSGVIFPGSSAQLTAKIDPTDAEVTATWKSNNLEVATVSAIGLVQIVGKGNATITATIGDFTAEYNLSTESPLDDAKGFWLFDDSGNLGKGIVGGDLYVNPAAVTVVPGPSETNGAVRGSWEASGEEEVVNMRWDHTNLTKQYTSPENNDVIWNYTIMMDIKLLYQEDEAYALDGTALRQTWDPVMQNAPGNRSGVFILWMQYEDDRGAGWAMNVDGSYHCFIRYPDIRSRDDGVANLKGKEPWVRFIYTMTYTESDNSWKVWGYMNGKPSISEENSMDNTFPVWQGTDYWPNPVALEIRMNEPLHFMTNRKGDKRYKGQYDLAALAVWDRALSDEEIATLGGISK